MPPRGARSRSHLNSTFQATSHQMRRSHPISRPHSTGDAETLQITKTDHIYDMSEPDRIELRGTRAPESRAEPPPHDTAAMTAASRELPLEPSRVPYTQRAILARPPDLGSREKALTHVRTRLPKFLTTIRVPQRIRDDTMSKLCASPRRHAKRAVPTPQSVGSSQGIEKYSLGGRCANDQDAKKQRDHSRYLMARDASPWTRSP